MPHSAPGRRRSRISQARFRWSGLPWLAGLYWGDGQIAAAAQSSRFSMVSHGVSRSLRADDREVVGQRRTQHRCGAASRRQTRHHLNFRLRASPAAHRPAPPCRRCRCHRSRRRRSYRCAPAPSASRQRSASRVMGVGEARLAGVAIPHRIHTYTGWPTMASHARRAYHPNGHILRCPAIPTTITLPKRSQCSAATATVTPSALFLLRSVFRHPAAPPLTDIVYAGNGRTKSEE